MAITQAGSVLRFAGPGSVANTGTVSSTITVPTCDLVIGAVSGYGGSANYFSGGGMTFTKSGVDTAMTVAVTGANGADNSTSFWQGAMFYQVQPDVGSNKTWKWDWAGTGSAAENSILFSLSFWSGVDTASAVRHALGVQAGNTPYTTGTLTASSGDLIVAWAVGYVANTEGTIDSWSNLTLLDQTVRGNLDADGAWATGSPSGNTTVAASTDTNFQDGGIVAIVLKPAAAGTKAMPVFRQPIRRIMRRF